MADSKEFAVSDQTGEYVFFTNDLTEAKDEAIVIEACLAKEGQEGSAAIMRKRDGEHGYELYL